MPWLVIDLLIALLAIGLLLLAALRLWRTVKSVSRSVADAGAAVGAAGDRLAAAQAEAPQRREPSA